MVERHKSNHFMVGWWWQSAQDGNMSLPFVIYQSGELAVSHSSLSYHGGILTNVNNCPNPFNEQWKYTVKWQWWRWWSWWSWWWWWWWSWWWCLWLSHLELNDLHVEEDWSCNTDCYKPNRDDEVPANTEKLQIQRNCQQNMNRNWCKMGIQNSWYFQHLTQRLRWDFSSVFFK